MTASERGDRQLWVANCLSGGSLSTGHCGRRLFDEDESQHP